MTNSWVDLARQSIVDPRAAAPILVGIPLERSVVPMALALIAALNGILYGLLLPASFFPGGMSAPIVLALVVGAVIWLSAWIMTFVGRMFGGEGRIEGLLRVALWLQVLRLVAQVVLSVVGLAVPSVAWMLGMAAGIWGLYMMVCFVAAAHGFESRLKAVGVMAVTFFAAVLALSVLLSALGIAPLEV